MTARRGARLHFQTKTHVFVCGGSVVINVVIPEASQTKAARKEHSNNQVSMRRCVHAEKLRYHVRHSGVEWALGVRQAVGSGSRTLQLADENLNGKLVAVQLRLDVCSRKGNGRREKGKGCASVYVNE